MELENKTNKAIIVPLWNKVNKSLPKTKRVIYPQESYDFDDEDVQAAKLSGLTVAEVKAVESKTGNKKVETKVVKKKATKKKVAKKVSKKSK